jgi:hypothetical protein
VPGYDDLPCGERDLPGDIGYVLRSLPPALGLRALPALCAALGRAEDFGTMGLVEALLAFTFGEPASGLLGGTSEDDPEDMSEQTAPPTLDPAALTPEQRQALTAMATTHELWTVGNLFFVLRSYGIPTQRAELAALLGLPVVRDEAAELAAQARFHRVHMHNPGEAAQLLRRAAELAPGDASRVAAARPGPAHRRRQRRGPGRRRSRPRSSTPITPRPTSPAASSSSTPTRRRPPPPSPAPPSSATSRCRPPPTAPPAWP